METLTEQAETWQVFDRRSAPLKNIVVGPSLLDVVCEVFPVHQRDHMGRFNGDHAAADAVDAIGLARAALIVRAVNAHADLLAAAKAVLAWRVADFDTVAEMFYRDTGYLRPGKDYPAGMGGESKRKEAESAWNVWVDRKNAELTDQLTTAIAKGETK